MRFRHSGTLLALLTLMLAACGDDASQTAAGQQGPSQGAAVEVGVRVLQAQNVDLQVDLPGRTSAFEAAEIRPQVSGIVVERLFEEGSLVEKGRQLYQIDPATYQADYNAAVAELKRAQANLQSVSSQAGRYKKLVEVNAVSRQQYDDIVANLGVAQAEVSIAKSSVNRAQINLDYTKVRSPITGRIGKSAVTPGALVTANQAAALALVQQYDPIYVDVSQSSSEMMALREKMEEGQVEGAPDSTRVELILDDLGRKYPHTGTLKFSDVTVDTTTGNVQIRAIFPNPDGTLLPGLFVRTIVTQGQLSNALLVPQQAVVRAANGQAMAWIVDAESKAQTVPVETAQAIGDKWVVTKGLKSGDKVILQGAIKIQAGAAVKPVDLAAEADAPLQAPAAGGEKPAESGAEDVPPGAPEAEPPQDGAVVQDEAAGGTGETKEE